MIMGVDKILELIECIKKNFPEINMYNSMIFRLMAAQSGESIKMLMHAVYYKKPSESHKLAPLHTSRDSGITASEKTHGTILSDRISQAVSVDNIASTVSVDDPKTHETLSIDFSKLNEELQGLNKHHALVKDVVESYMFLALRKSIFCDMCFIMKKKYQILVRSPNVPEKEKMKMYKLWRDLYDQYNKINLPPGFNMIHPNQRRSLEAYIADYRENQRVNAINNLITGAVNQQQSIMPQHPPISVAQNQEATMAQNLTAQNPSIKVAQNRGAQNHKFNTAQNPSIKLAQNQPAEIDSEKLAPTLSKDHNIVIGRAATDASESMPPSAISQGSSENMRKLSSKSIILVDDDSDHLNLAHTSISKISPVDSEVIGRYASGSPARKSIIVDDDYDKYNQLNDSMKNTLHVDLAPQNEELDTLLPGDLGIQLNNSDRSGNDCNTGRSKITADFSEEGDDVSFIAAVRSLNKTSSPEYRKKRKGRDGMGEAKVDCKWEEGFVQGLFYNFGMDSPFGVYEQSEIDQLYLEGFKAASAYYTRKVGEQEQD